MENPVLLFYSIYSYIKGVELQLWSIMVSLLYCFSNILKFKTMNISLSIKGYILWSYTHESREIVYYHLYLLFNMFQDGIPQPLLTTEDYLDLISSKDAFPLRDFLQPCHHTEPVKFRLT